MAPGSVIPFLWHVRKGWEHIRWNHTSYQGRWEDLPKGDNKRGSRWWKSALSCLFNIHIRICDPLRRQALVVYQRLLNKCMHHCPKWNVSGLMFLTHCKPNHFGRERVYTLRFRGARHGTRKRQRVGVFQLTHSISPTTPPPPRHFPHYCMRNDSLTSGSGGKDQSSSTNIYWAYV